MAPGLTEGMEARPGGVGEVDRPVILTRSMQVFRQFAYFFSLQFAFFFSLPRIDVVPCAGFEQTEKDEMAASSSYVATYM